MAQSSQISTGQPAKGPSSSSGGDKALPDPTNRSIFSLNWHKLIQKRLNALIAMEAVIDRRGGALRVSDANSQLPIPGSASGGGSGTPGVLQQYMVLGSTVASFNFNALPNVSYLLCGSWDGHTLGPNTSILVPWKLQQVASELVDGITINYSAYNSASQSRTADNGAATETQVITPRYLPGDLIFAMGINFFLGNSNGLIDVNLDGRAFAGPA